MIVKWGGGETFVTNSYKTYLMSVLQVKQMKTHLQDNSDVYFDKIDHKFEEIILQL